MLLITPNEHLSSSLPFWLSKDGVIMLALLPKSKAHSEFYDRAFHFWKELQDVPLKSCTGEGPMFSAIYISLRIHLYVEVMNNNPTEFTHLFFVDKLISTYIIFNHLRSLY